MSSSSASASADGSRTLREVMDASGGVLVLDASLLHESQRGADDLEEMTQQALPDVKIAFVVTPAMIDSNYSEAQFKAIYMQEMGVTDCKTAATTIQYLVQSKDRLDDLPFMRQIALALGCAHPAAWIKTVRDFYKQYSNEDAEAMCAQATRVCAQYEHDYGILFPSAWAKYHTAALSAKASASK